MKIQKIIISVLLLFSSCMAVFGESKYRTIEDTRVVIVTRVSVTPPVNDAFFSQYRTKKAPFVNRFRATRKHVNSDKTYVYLDTSAKLGLQYDGVPLNDEIFIAKVLDIPKNRIVNMPYFLCYAGNVDAFPFYLNLSVQIVIPEGAKFVYLGSFMYDLDPKTFSSGEFELVDEYDAACAFVAEEFGDDAKLVRVPLRGLDYNAE